MVLESTLDYLWHLTGQETSSVPTERDYLRSIHHPIGFWLWCYSMQVEMKHIYSSISISSIWVDHIPQCWYGSVGGNWGKPSCELADILVVVWDSKLRKSGNALLVQAKRGKSYNRIPLSNPSTKKEINLLGKAPKFLLSNQLSTSPGKAPQSMNSKLCCEFKLTPYSGVPLEHCTFLQIRDARSKRWPRKTATYWQTMWPPNLHQKAYSEVIKEMLPNNGGSTGKRFVFGNMNNDWDRLVTVLVKETVGRVGGTAQGQSQHSVRTIRDKYFLFENIGGVDLPTIDYPESNEPRGGISTVFITVNEGG